MIDCEDCETVTDTAPLIVRIDADDVDDAHPIVERIQRDRHEADRSSISHGYEYVVFLARAARSYRIAGETPGKRASRMRS